jgi:PAS domain S-box-containing protein
MLVALFCAGITYWTAARLEREQAALAFRDASALIGQRLQRELHGLVDELYAVRALIDIAPRVDRAGFAAFVSPILARNPELSAIEWVPRMRAADVSEYARRARVDGLDFRITQRDEAGRLAPTEQRAEYYPVFYVEPQVGNEEAFGLDHASSADRRAALIAARDGGRATVAGPLRLVQTPEDPSGYLVIVPSYSRGEDVDTDAARRESFSGVVVGVLRLSRLLATVATPDVHRRLSIAIFDDARRIVTHDAAARAAPAQTDQWPAERVVEIPLGFADRELILHARTTSAFLKEHRTRMPAAIASGGGVLCVMLALYLGSVRREYETRARADAALVESEHHYRMLVENAPDAVVVYDVDARRFIDANSKATAMVEVSRERLLASSPLDFSPKLQPDGRESSAVVEDLVRRSLAGESVVVQWNRRSADGTEIPVELRLTLLPDASRRLIRCSAIDVRDRRQSEIRQLMMARELDHRVKNNLATVLSIAEQTCASARSIEEFRDAFVGRVRAMARTHEALAARRWDGVPLSEIAQLTLEPYVDGAPGRATFRGDPVRLSAAASSCLCMAFHELAANAAKDGALSESAGRIELAWDHAESGALAIEWAEHDGPRVVAPTTSGFGSRLIKGVLSHELGGRVTLEYGAGGVRCRMIVPPEHWTMEGAKA